MQQSWVFSLHCWLYKILLSQFSFFRTYDICSLKNEKICFFSKYPCNSLNLMLSEYLNKCDEISALPQTNSKRSYSYSCGDTCRVCRLYCSLLHLLLWVCVRIPRQTLIAWLWMLFVIHNSSYDTTNIDRVSMNICKDKRGKEI